MSGHLFKNRVSRDVMQQDNNPKHTSPFYQRMVKEEQVNVLEWLVKVQTLIQ